MKYQSLDEIKRKIKHYCAYQERSHFQVENKLKDWGMFPETIDHILLELIQENYLNEERFARTYVRGKFYHNKWGKQKIIQGLKNHKIYPNLIEKALTEIPPEDYENMIRHLIKQKKSSLKQHNKYQNRQKIIHFMLQKGYEYSDIAPFLE